MSVLVILVVIALICAALSFVPRFEMLHRVATILLCIALLVQYVPKGD